MDISRLAHAAVALAIAAACAIGLHADAALDVRPLVVYVGHWSPEVDVSWRKFMDALAATQPQLLSQARFEFIGTPDNDDEAVRRLLADKLPVQAPALTVAPNGSSAQAIRAAAPAVPVVFASYDDPVRGGFVSTLQPRVEPITGISLLDALDGKRLEILHEAYPAMHSVAVLADDAWAVGDALERVREAGEREGLQVTVLFASGRADVHALFARPEARRFDAWYVPPSYVEYQAHDVVIERMRAWHRPCIFGAEEDVRDGGLMAYAQDTSFVWPAMADLVARVLAGESPGAIPVVRPQRFILALRTSADTGVPLPDIAVVRRADVVLR